MKFLTGVLPAMTILLNSSSAFSQEVEKVEIKKELQRLLSLREEVKNLMNKNEKILRRIEKERRKLAEEKNRLKEEIKAVRNERYEKLAVIFSKMDPELAGQKISAMDNMTEAAYIFLNMKERYAGRILNYVVPEKVKEIVSIMTKQKTEKNGSSK